MTKTDPTVLPPDLTIEEAMDRLESIVRTLEGDSRNLEERH